MIAPRNALLVVAALAALATFGLRASRLTTADVAGLRAALSDPKRQVLAVWELGQRGAAALSAIPELLALVPVQGAVRIQLAWALVRIAPADARVVAALDDLVARADASLRPIVVGARDAARQARLGSGR